MLYCKEYEFESVTQIAHIAIEILALYKHNNKLFAAYDNRYMEIDEATWRLCLELDTPKEKYALQVVREYSPIGVYSDYKELKTSYKVTLENGEKLQISKTVRHSYNTTWAELIPTNESRNEIHAYNVLVWNRRKALLGDLAINGESLVSVATNDKNPGGYENFYHVIKKSTDGYKFYYNSRTYEESKIMRLYEEFEKYAESFSYRKNEQKPGGFVDFYYILGLMESKKWVNVYTVDAPDMPYHDVMKIRSEIAKWLDYAEEVTKSIPWYSVHKKIKPVSDLAHLKDSTNYSKVKIEKLDSHNVLINGVFVARYKTSNDNTMIYDTNGNEYPLNNRYGNGTNGEKKQAILSKIGLIVLKNKLQKLGVESVFSNELCLIVGQCKVWFLAKSASNVSFEYVINDIDNGTITTDSDYVSLAIKIKKAMPVVETLPVELPELPQIAPNMIVASQPVDILEMIPESPMPVETRAMHCPVCKLPEYKTSQQWYNETWRTCSTCGHRQYVTKWKVSLIRQSPKIKRLPKVSLIRTYDKPQKPQIALNCPHCDKQKRQSARMWYKSGNVTCDHCGKFAHCGQWINRNDFDVIVQHITLKPQPTTQPKLADLEQLISMAACYIRGKLSPQRACEVLKKMATESDYSALLSHYGIAPVAKVEAVKVDSAPVMAEAIVEPAMPNLKITKNEIIQNPRMYCFNILSNDELIGSITKYLGPWEVTIKDKAPVSFASMGQAESWVMGLMA